MMITKPFRLFPDMKNRHYSRLLLENLVKDHVDYLERHMKTPENVIASNG